MEIQQTYQFSGHRTSYIVTYILFLLIQCIKSEHSDRVAPLITPNQPDITVLPKENVKLVCQSTEPIHWRFHKTFYGDHEVYNSYNQMSKYPYESVLELPQVDYSYVDYYYCAKNSSEFETNLDTLVENKLASNIYLFVEDRRHPLVRASIPILEGNLNENIIVPCKPTSKKFEIQLIKDGNVRNQFESTFTPTDGFRIKLKSSSAGGQYTCHVKFDTAERFDIYFTIEVKAGVKYWNEPRLTSNDHDLIEGGSLELNCSVEAERGARLGIKWKLPNENIAIEEGRVQFSSPIHQNLETNSTLYKAIDKLIINRLTKMKDIGIYECVVEDHYGNRKSAALNINKILEPFITITPLTNTSTIIMKSNQSEAVFSVKYSGLPEPIPMWHDIVGNSIPWSNSESNRIEASLHRQNKQTTLKIKYPQIMDSGSYILLMENDQIQKEHEFQLLVKDKPQLRMSDVFYDIGQNVSITCEVLGYPSSTVTWSFIPCDKFKFNILCNESKISQFESVMVKTTQKTILEQTSTLSFTPMGLGVVICHATNAEGDSEVRANVVVNDSSEDFNIFTKNESPIIIGDDVSIVCGASAFKYAEVNWYKDHVLVENTINVQVISNNTSYFHRKEIRWNSIKKDDSGKYICRADVIKSDNYVNKSWELDVMEPTEPEILVTNIEPGLQLNFSLGEPVQLLCEFSGIPPPKITWYKDGKEILPGDNSSRITLHAGNSVLDFHLNENDEGVYKCTAENRAGLVSRETRLTITNISSVNKVIVFSVIAAILLLLICIFLLCKRFRRERWQMRELRAERLANIDIGNTENVYHDKIQN